MTLRRSPLDERHRALGARMGSFGGWDMPLSYPAGPPAEHLACRRHAAVFDVSHLGTLRVDGSGAFDALQAALSNDLRRITPGRAQYSLLCDEAGSVLDDLIVWWRAPDHFDVMPNASNTEQVHAALGGADVTAERAVLALQGPAARDVLRAVCPEAAGVGRFRVAEVTWAGAAGGEGSGVTLVVAGTGYTGEDGVEIAVPAAAAPALWDAVVAAGAQPAGLIARDTLRIEAGYPLHGAEWTPGVTPLQVGVDWAVAPGKGPFPGAEALAAERAAGPSRVLRGLVGVGRQPLRAGATVRGPGWEGVTTSGTYSPVLERGVALAWCPPDVAAGTPVVVHLRGRDIDAEVRDLPMVRPGPGGA